MSGPTPTNFALFVSNANTLIGQAYQDTIDLVYPKIATEMPGKSQQTVFGWTGKLPKGRKWVGPRVVTTAAAQTYTVVHQPWEATTGIDRFALDDDQMGVYYRQLPDLGVQAKRQPDFWMRDLIEAIGDYAGTVVQLGLDGLTHWNTAHPINVYNAALGTYCNDYVGGVAGVGGPISINSIATIVEAMYSRKGEDNERLGVTPNVLMHPNELVLEVEFLLKSMSMSPPAWGTISGQVGAADNALRRFALEPILNTHLTSATKFYVLDTTKPMKPFTWILREAAKFAQRTNETDPVVFDLHRYLFGYWGRGAPAWNLAWLSSRSG